MRQGGELPSVQITRGNATDEDLAALAGVLPAAYAQESRQATADEPSHRTTWSTARRMRRVPGDARWGRFSG